MIHCSRYPIPKPLPSGKGLAARRRRGPAGPLPALGLRKRIVASLLQFKQIFATIPVQIRLRCLPRLHAECTEGRFLDNVATISAFLPEIDAAFAFRMRTMENLRKRGKVMKINVYNWSLNHRLSWTTKSYNRQ